MNYDRKTINKVECHRNDWSNLLTTKWSKENDEMDKTIQDILHHPLKELVSLPFMYSFAYRQAVKFYDKQKAARIACKEVAEKLDQLY